MGLPFGSQDRTLVRREHWEQVPRRRHRNLVLQRLQITEQLVGGHLKPQQQYRTQHEHDDAQQRTPVCVCACLCLVSVRVCVRACERASICTHGAATTPNPDLLRVANLQRRVELNPLWQRSTALLPQSHGEGGGVPSQRRHTFEVRQLMDDPGWRYNGVTSGDNGR